MVNLNVRGLAFVFVLILFVHMHDIIWRGGVCLKLEVQGQGAGEISDADEYGLWGLENWTIFMGTIYVLSLSSSIPKNKQNVSLVISKLVPAFSL